MKIQNARKQFNGLIVLEDFNIAFPPSGVCCLFGPSGSGKTTLLNVICGLTKLDLGDVLDVPENISYMFQENRLLPWFSAVVNVSAAAGVNMEQAKKWLNKVGLPEDSFDKLPHELSGGMQRRVALARALAFASDAVILDEPFKEIDHAAKTAIMKSVAAIAKDKPVILVTHDAQEAAELSDIVFVFQGPPLEVAEKLIVNNANRDSVIQLLKK